MGHSIPGVAYPLWVRITEICGVLGLTKTKLSELSGVRTATFEAWRTSKRPPQQRTLNPVIAAINGAAHEAGSELRIHPTEALALAGVVPHETNASTVDDIRDLIQVNANFTAEQRAALLQIIDSFTSNKPGGFPGSPDTGS